MVSDQDIAKAVSILLTQSDHKSFTSLTDVVHHLSQKLGFDLSPKTLFIRDQINLFLFRSQPQYHHPPPPPSPLQQPPLQPPTTAAAVAKDHFALQHAQYRFNPPQPPQPQFLHPHFALQGQQLSQQLSQQQQQSQQQLILQQNQQQQRQRHQVELNFSQPAPQIQPVKEVKGEDGGGKAVEKAKKGVTAGTKRRGGPGGLNKLCGITPELQVIVGESALSRTDIVKQLWAYIKKNNLQDPGNKRKIICDDALRVVFETDCTDMFKMNKLLAKHIIRLEPTKESSRKRSKVNVEPEVEPVVEPTDNVPCQVIISDALANCLGTEEREMSESEALRLVWEYIKINNLEDPQNSVMILCDENLKELFGCESISAMGIPDLVTRNHLVKQ